MKEWSRLDTCRMLAGAFSGASAQFVGHPIDTIKVRMQLSTTPPNIFTTTKHIFQSGGVRGTLSSLLVKLTSTMFTDIQQN